MELTKKDGRVYARPDGERVSEELIQSIASGGIKGDDACEFIRLEHPHCAFFISSHDTPEGTNKRKTLYTPEGRLHIEYRKSDEGEVQVGRYVKKPDQLETMLFYLRDVEIKPALGDAQSDSGIIFMPNTPMAEFYSFVQDDIAAQALAQNETIARHIFSQLRRIYNSRLDILSQKINGTVNCAVFCDVSDEPASEELMEKWHYYYIRKARILNK
jgi:hypothetical protein